MDAESGLVHTVIGTAATVNDVTQAARLLHGQQQDAFGDAGCQGVDRRPEDRGLKTRWPIALRPGKRAVLDRSRPLAQVIERVEQIKSSIRAKVERPLRVIKQQFGHARVRYGGLAKNTARLQVMFALGTAWMARRPLPALQA
ncbi:transposase [Acidovorax cattleyae]|nr:transposase [Paracidovorax cattleyae]